MLVLTPKGLYCPAGDFYIDPRSACDHAIITHAHSDHARRGSKHYYCVNSGVSLLKTRLGQSISVHAIPYGEKYFFRDVAISFHPAGHILGSSQVRVEFCGEVWVVSGDYKRDYDPTCEPFETVTCDVFITEATFGTPGFKWKKNANFGDEIYDWWRKNSQSGFNSVLLAYSLGKAQRVLGCLFNKTQETVLCHTTTEILNECYRAEGMALAPSVSINNMLSEPFIKGGLFLVPPAFFKSPSRELLGKKYKTAFASGWLAGRKYNYDEGFIMSDHADWDDLLRTILETKAARIYVQQRGSGALVKKLRSMGLKAYSDAALIPKDPRQIAFF